VAGGYLRRARQTAGLTQEDLASKTGLSVRAISDLERGLTARPRRTSLQLLTDALDLPEDTRRLVMAALGGVARAVPATGPAAPAGEGQLSAGLYRITPVDPHEAGSTASLHTRPPAQLPTSIPDFTGRAEQVKQLCTLLASPRLLLLDEPLAALDAPRKAEILGYIELLRDEFHLPMVYVSHAIEEVTRLADRLVLVSDGRSIAEGEVAEVLSRADLKPHTGRFEAGAVIETRVARHDERYGLTVLAFDGGELVVANLDALPGEPVRARIRSRDVALALERPRAASFQNVLEASVESVGGEFGAIVEVALRVGATPLAARITRESAERLAIGPGTKVFALVKAIAIDRRSVGYA